VSPEGDRNIDRPAARDRSPERYYSPDPRYWKFYLVGFDDRSMAPRLFSPERKTT
jgi:hypothetical protein